jgi:hypothetical protein
MEKINPAPVRPLLCCACGAWKATLADLDGEPFRAFYCPPCAEARHERLIESRMDSLDRRLMSGQMTQAAYDAAVRAL